MHIKETNFPKKQFFQKFPDSQKTNFVNFSKKKKLVYMYSQQQTYKARGIFNYNF